MGVTGTLSQEHARVNVVGSWDGLAGAGAFIEVYRNANCSGSALYQEPIAWNQSGGITQLFDSAVYPEIQRGHDYCGKVVLGDASQTASLGRLEFATFTGNQFTFTKRLGRLFGQYWLSYSAPVTSKLYGGTYSIRNNQCSGGQLLASVTIEDAQQSTQQWVNQRRPPSTVAEPMHAVGSSRSGDTVAMEVTVPDNIVSFGGRRCGGEFIYLEGSWIGRAGGNAKVELYDNAACSGASVAASRL